MNRQLVKNLTILVTVVLFGLIAWVVITNVLVPPETQVDANIATLTRVRVTPDLEIDSLELMKVRRSLTAGELADFQIYLDDVYADKSDESVLMMKIMEPTRPLDFGYTQLYGGTVEASGEGGVAEAQGDEGSLVVGENR
jgi:hypothetical protein